MKEIRRINKVVSLEPEISNSGFSESEIKTILGTFDSEPDYFQQVIRPMLSPGHENELVFWLKEIGLIKNTQKCDSSTNCSMMSWISARSNDMYQWKCNGCSTKKSIREDSVFNNVKCNFKDAIRIILGWCKGISMESMASMLGVRKYVVGQLYKKSAAVAEKYIKAHLNEWRVGGFDRIVLVNTYPEIGDSSDTQRGKVILCLSELQSFPQRYWIETLNSSKGQHNINTVKNRVLKAITEIVVPGTVLVVPSESRYCSYETVSTLKHLYPLIITTADLERHNTVDQNLLDNLQTIWREPLDACREAQYYNSEYIQQFVIGHIWRKKYDKTAFEMLVYQIGI